MNIDPIKLAVVSALAKQRHEHQDELEIVKDAHLQELRAAIKTVASAGSPPPASPPHSITVKRSNASTINLLLGKVLTDVGDDARVGVVYSELVRLASTPDRPRPFTGPATPTGIPYLHNNGREQKFTYRALAGRLKTRRKAEP